MPPKLHWLPEAIRFDEDTGSGAVIEQLTSEPVSSTNIYCEQRYASADGATIALSRRPFGQPSQIWLCDLSSLQLCRAAEGAVLGAVSRRNALYYLARAPDPRLMRLDLADFSTRECHRFGDTPPPASATFSPDERVMVHGPYRVRDQVFALRRLDLATGEDRVLCELEDMMNPHAQFDPGAGRWVMVQINRGGRMDPSRPGRRMTGPLGATLVAVDSDTGAVRPLPAGRPHTPRISGHETWVGTTGRVIFTAGQYAVSASSHVTLDEPPESERGHPAAAIYQAAPGDESARVLARGLLFNHVAASDDGRFFVADDHATGRIFVGSMATGKCLPLCETHTRHGATQLGHIHAYMTPDNRHVIFNSIVTGVPQVYAATLPERFLADVLG
jgi:hypothetical protein